MIKNKFLNLLRKLEKPVFLSFTRFLKSRYTAEDGPWVLYAYVRKYYPEFSDAKKLSAEFLNQEVFKGKPDSSAKNISNLYSDLYLALKDFLLVQELNNNDMVKQFLWLSTLKRYNMEAEFDLAADKVQKNLKEMPQRTTTDFLYRLVGHYYHAFLRNPGKGKLDAVSIGKYSEDLDLFYTICKLKATCELLNLSKIESQVWVSDEALNLLKSHLLELAGQEALLYKLYEQVFLLQTSQDEKHFYELEHLFYSHLNHLSKYESHTLILYMLNHIAIKIREGKRDYKIRFHEINKAAWESGFFARQGEMPVAQYDNIISIACGVKDFDWAIKFARNQGKFLKEKDRVSTQLLSLSFYFFEQGLFSQVIECIRQFNSKDLTQYVRAQMLLLMSLYELNENKLEIQRIYRNFEDYLDRKRNNYPGLASAAGNFIKGIQLLIRTGIKSDNIRDQILNLSPLANKEWFERKLNQADR